MIRVCSINIKDFEHTIKKKNVICFGQGQKYKDLCEQFQIQKYTRLILDNSVSNEGYVNNDGIMVKNPISYYEVDKEKDILIISSIYYAEEMIKQADSIVQLDGITCYVTDMIDYTEEYIFSKKRESVIPKVIHYFWVGPNTIPDKFKRNIETWYKQCPNYEIKLWNESNYDFSKCTYMKEAYEAKKWGFVPDYARLDVIHQCGGIYLDTDVELLKPLDELLGFDMFCGFESPKYIAYGLGFGGKARNPIFKEMMNEYQNIHFILPNGELNQVASPIYQTRVLKRAGFQINGKTQCINNMIALTMEYFAPINMCNFGNITANSFSNHQYAATWVEGSVEQSKKREYEKYMYVKDRMLSD